MRRQVKLSSHLTLLMPCLCFLCRYVCVLLQLDVCRLSRWRLCGNWTSTSVLHQLGLQQPAISSSTWTYLSGLQGALRHACQEGNPSPLLRSDFSTKTTRLQLRISPWFAFTFCWGLRACLGLLVAKGYVLLRSTIGFCSGIRFCGGSWWEFTEVTWHLLTLLFH